MLTTNPDELNNRRAFLQRLGFAIPAIVAGGVAAPMGPPPTSPLSSADIYTLFVSEMVQALPTAMQDAGLRPGSVLRSLIEAQGVAMTAVFTSTLQIR